jgi:hypothetical protein
VTRRGGKVVTVFSHRWFSGKEVQPWLERHPFERLGLVLGGYRKSGGQHRNRARQFEAGR